MCERLTKKERKRGEQQQQGSERLQIKMKQEGKQGSRVRGKMTYDGICV